MSKFVKYGLIAGCVMILAGAGITTASFALGANPVRISRFMEERFDHDSRYSELGQTIVGEITSVAAADWDTVEPVLESRAEEMRNFLDEEGGFEASYPAVTDLDIRQRGGNVEVAFLAWDDVLTVKGTGMSLENLHYDGSDHWQKLTVLVPDGADCQIFVPDTWSLKDMEAEVTGGDFYGQDIAAREAEYKAMGGVIEVTQKGGTALELDCEGGSLVWNGLETLPEKIEADCIGGSVSIMLPEGMNDEGFGYELKCDNGELVLPGLTMEGKDKKEIAGQPGKTKFDLKAENGGVINVTVE